MRFWKKRDDNILDFPMDEIRLHSGSSYLLGDYAQEMSAYFESATVLSGKEIPSPDQRFVFRNLLITDVRTAHEIIWQNENSRIRNFANNHLFFPTRLNRIQVFFGTTFSALESNDAGGWRWAVGEQGFWYIEILNQTTFSTYKELNFALEHIVVDDPIFKFTLNHKVCDSKPVGRHLFFNLKLDPGINLFVIELQGGHNTLAHFDDRNLKFRLIDFKLEDAYDDVKKSDYSLRTRLHELGFEKVTNLFGISVSSFSDGFTSVPIFESKHTLGDKIPDTAWYRASGSAN